MKTNDLLKLMSEKIAERISGGTPLGAEEIYTVIEESISSLTDMKTQEIPAFVHIVIKRDDEYGYIATCPALSRCKGKGKTEEEAVARLKEDIELWTQSCLHVEKEMEMKKLVEEMFGRKDF